MSDPGSPVPPDGDAEPPLAPSGDGEAGFSGSAADLPDPRRSGGRPRPPRPPRPVIDPRPYRWAVGIIGLAVVTVAFVVQLLTHGSATTGVPPGRALRPFAAPLAASTLDGDPTLRPTCRPDRHDPRALNVCLLVRRGPLVLALFALDGAVCERQVSALQTLSRQFPHVQFAAVAVGASHAAAAAAVRAHGWTIPVAYDRDGAVGTLYGVVACPMVQAADRGGIVRARLIGQRWASAAALAPYVRELR